MNPEGIQAGSKEPTQLGRYEILRKLGQGGMGAVYLAQDTRLDRRVAIKVLPPETVNDPEAIARFQREAKALAKLSHPGIVQAYDTDENAGQHFLVMEYVEGTNLSSLLREKGPVPPTIAADYIHQAAVALQHAHEKGLVHRDLKPSNLLLTPRCQVKILDLGLARFLQDQIGDPTRTREGMGMGTPDYAAPEQFRDAHKADARSDIYGLGCTLYHLVTGQVPFPGSSMAEKCQAHEQKEPPALEEVCPAAPAGLAFVTRRMMAKRPADRFQTAQELAEALAPYVAGSSLALPHLKNTISWHGSQLTMVAPRPRSRIRRWAIAWSAITALLVLIGLSWSWLSRNPESSPRGDSVASDNKAEEPKPPVRSDPNLLTVSKDPKAGGEFRTIKAALARVDRPGMTVRVLDSETYAESIVINQRSKHEGLLLEAPKGATIEPPPPARCGINIIGGVRRVTVRGFRLRTDREQVFLCVIGQSAAGALLDTLDCRSSQGNTVGIFIEHTTLSEGDAPVIVQNCTCAGLSNGIRIAGLDMNSHKAMPCGRVVVRQNKVSDCGTGIWVSGRVSDLHIVGNLVWSCGVDAIQLTDLFDGTSQILVANNTLQAPRLGLHIIEPVRGVRDVTFRNNLFLAEQGPDLAFTGKDRQPLAGWRIDHNWRKVRRPETAKADAQGWVLSDTDKFVDKIELLSSDPHNARFLRPPKDSPLATGGAGDDLPTYVGAVPPEGTEPWDWQKTWEARYPKTLLTVSRDPKAGGEFRTISDALKSAKARMTIRVLDDGAYPEPLVLDDPGRHEGLVLEAPNRATILLAEDAYRALVIKNVPNVRIKGFRFRDTAAKRPDFPLRGFVGVSLHASGLILEELDIEAKGHLLGIDLQNIKTSANEMPVIVRKCFLRGG